MILTIWDSVRFAIAGFSLIPAMASAFTISSDPASNGRILLWLLAPQLIVPIVCAGAAFGFFSDKGIRSFGVIAKLLSALPAIATFSGLLQFNKQSFGLLIQDQAELRMLLFSSAIVLMDLIFCIILLFYREKQGEHQQPTMH